MVLGEATTSTRGGGSAWQSCVREVAKGRGGNNGGGFGERESSEVGAARQMARDGELAAHGAPRGPGCRWFTRGGGAARNLGRRIKGRHGAEGRKTRGRQKEKEGKTDRT